MVKNNFLKEKNLKKNNNGPDPINKNKSILQMLKTSVESGPHWI